MTSDNFSVCTDGNHISAPPVVAAFFDVDETVIRGASAYHLAREFYRRKFFGIRDILFAARQSFLYVALGEDVKRIEAARDRALQAMAGHSVKQIRAIGEEVYHQVLGHRIFPGTKRLIDKHLEAGHEVWLVTATPQDIASLIARRLGTTGALGTKVAISNGRYRAELVGEMMHGKGKAQAIEKLAAQRGIDLSQSFAYGDSLNDLPLLQLVANPCAINPDPRLRIWAVANQWPVRDFRRRRRDVRRVAKRSALGVAGAWLLLEVLKRVRHLTGARRSWK